MSGGIQSTPNNDELLRVDRGESCIHDVTVIERCRSRLSDAIRCYRARHRL